MEIAKEKFIETFKKECEKAVDTINVDAFRASGTNEEPGIEIVPNNKVSFYAVKTFNNDEQNTFSYEGKILFAGFVDYKSVKLEESEFESLYDFYLECEFKSRLAAKNKIISEGEAVLEKIIS